MNKTTDIPSTRSIEGGWHSRCNYNINNYQQFTVCGVIMGCGLAQMYGIYVVNDDNFNECKKVLEKIKNDYKEDGCGAIIATLGSGYYGTESYLLKLGFKKQIEYTNWRHRNGDTQRLYTLTIE